MDDALPPVPDAELIERCLRKDNAAWDAIVVRYQRKVFHIAYKFTGKHDAAEDLTQDVFIKVYRTLGSYDVEKGAFTTWLTTLTRNLLVDHFRRSKQDRITDSIDGTSREEEDALSISDRLQDPRPSPDDRLATKETQKMVQKALVRLSPELRNSLALLGFTGPGLER